LTDVAVQLLILMGIPSLALAHYLWHKRKMYLLEKGIQEKDDLKVRSERRIINGIFLTLAGIFMVLTPKIAVAAGIEANLSFELLLASLIVLCAGMALLIGSGILRYRTLRQCEKECLIEFK
jgi:hypothetical protein